MSNQRIFIIRQRVTYRFYDSSAPYFSKDANCSGSDHIVFMMKQLREVLYISTIKMPLHLVK
jgi:hypothetical protein